jgi:hypothetical protein
VLDPPLGALECQETIILVAIKTDVVFRPSNWAERLCGVMSHFSRNQRVRYPPCVTPIVADGVKCVAIETRLKTSRTDERIAR